MQHLKRLRPVQSWLQLERLLCFQLSHPVVRLQQRVRQLIVQILGLLHSQLVLALKAVAELNCDR